MNPVAIPSWKEIEAELDKGEQMGHQTVLQFAKVGQMLIEQMGDQPIREFVQRAGQEIPRLKRSSCHNYMTLARNLPLLEQQQPDSQRAALALIAETKRPAVVAPAPVAAVAPAPVTAVVPAFAVVDEGPFDGENSYGPRRAMSALQDAALAVWVEALAVFRAATVEVMRYDVNISDMLEAMGLPKGADTPDSFWACVEEADALPSKVGLLERVAQ